MLLGIYVSLRYTCVHTSDCGIPNHVYQTKYAIITHKGAIFDTLAALMLSLGIPIPELPGAEVWNVRNAWHSGPTVGLFCPAQVDQESEPLDLESY